MSKKFLVTLISVFGLLIFSGAGCIEFGGSAAATVGPLGMFRSPDRGENWASINTVLTAQGVKSLAGVNIYKIFTDPNDPDAIYAATRGQGLFYSYNRGDSWEQVVPLSGRFIYAVAIDPQNKCVLYVSDGPHIYKTTDCTRTWQLLYTEGRPNERIVSLAIDYARSSLIYAATVGGDILGSDDYGASWLVIRRFGMAVQSLVADPTAAKRIYVATQSNGLFRSDDAGSTWVDLNPGLSPYSGSLTFYRFILHPTKKNVIFWLSKYGILRSNDAGKTWADYKLITPPGGVNIYGFGIDPTNDNNIYYIGTIFAPKDASAELSLFGNANANLPIRSTFYKSVDGGKSWITKRLPSTAVPVVMYVHPTDPNVLFVGFTNPQQ